MVRTIGITPTENITCDTRVKNNNNCRTPSCRTDAMHKMRTNDKGTNSTENAYKNIITIPQYCFYFCYYAAETYSCHTPKLPAL